MASARKDKKEELFIRAKMNMQQADIIISICITERDGRFMHHRCRNFGRKKIRLRKR